MKVNKFLGLGVFLAFVLVFSLNFSGCSDGSSSMNEGETEDVGSNIMKANLNIVSYPTIKFAAGTAFSSTGIQVKVTYTNGKVKSVTEKQLALSVEGLSIEELNNMPPGRYKVTVRYTEGSRSATATYNIYVGGEIWSSEAALTRLDYEVQKPLTYGVGSSSVSQDIIVMGYNGDGIRFFFDEALPPPYTIKVGDKEPGNPVFTKEDFVQTYYDLHLTMTANPEINNNAGPYTGGDSYENKDKVGVYPIILIDNTENRKVGLTTEEATYYLLPETPAFYREGTSYKKVILVGRNGGGTMDTDPLADPDGDPDDQCVWVLNDTAAAYNTTNDAQYFANYVLTPEHIAEGAVFYRSTKAKALNTAEQLNGIKTNTSGHFFMTTDIDLEAISWGTGVSGFAGRLYGNNKTISNLKLMQKSGDTGMFNTFADTGVVVQDFTLQVTTPTPVTISGVRFGGLVGGLMNMSKPVVFRNINVEGTLMIASLTGNHGIVGALIGEAGWDKDILIENCVSNLDVWVNAAASNAADAYADTHFGGLVGKFFSSVAVVRNSASTGNVIVGGVGGNRWVGAGGLIGAIDRKEGTSVSSPSCIIENSFAAGTVSVTRTSGNYFGDGGGLIASYYSTTSGAVTIRNSAALNPVIAVSNGAGESYIRRARIFAGAPATNVTFVNNVANQDMKLGTTVTNGSTVTGSANDKNGMNIALSNKQGVLAVLNTNYTEPVWEWLNTPYPTLVK
ncbi:hypothetical protein AGMMS50212_00450 [Spirochaetia bacterium]|nr:hypothetical protein AGMMS50212_00450 [Spirochaetia bacterium]